MQPGQGAETGGSCWGGLGVWVWSPLTIINSLDVTCRVVTWVFLTEGLREGVGLTSGLVSQCVSSEILSTLSTLKPQTFDCF